MSRKLIATLTHRNRIIRAWWLGFWEHLFEPNSCGLTWEDDDDLSNAYDSGWNAADWIRGREAP